MSLRENIQNIFKPREVKGAEEAVRLDAAIKRENLATVEYLEGRMSYDQYKKVLNETFPLTKLDLRKLASKLNPQL